MKGFFIEITNNLLDPKHRKAMKESVWFFMWLLDKITSITEEGIGKVLGGKPITYEEVNKDLDIPSRTYKDWVSRLRAAGYINTKRTPYGLIFEVNKAKKSWGRRAGNRLSQLGDKPVEKQKRDGQEKTGDRQKKTGDGRKTDIQYKTDTRHIQDKGVCLELKDWNSRQQSPIQNFIPENIVRKHGAKKVILLMHEYGQQNGGFIRMLVELKK